jgi:ribosomal protein S18 acetylase RimI-like enzyme
MIEYSLSKEVKPQEIIDLRQAGHKESTTMWAKAIDLALCVAIARDSESMNRLIGIGFVVGNNRHAQLVDLVVHPDYRQLGIGGKLIDMRLEFCRQQGILYIGNTFDPSVPWLKDFYSKHGFRQIDFAMWQEYSLRNLSEGENQGEL